MKNKIISTIFLSACLLLSCVKKNNGSSFSDVESEASENSSFHQTGGPSSSDNLSFSEAPISNISSIDSSISASSSSKSSSASSMTESSLQNSSSLSSNSQEFIEEILTISHAKEYCLNIKETRNAVGYAVSSKSISIEAKILTVSASNCTKKGYDVSNPYKALVADKTGYMYAALSKNDYLKIKDYIGKDTTVYLLKGRVGLYYTEPELVVDEVEWLNKTIENLPSLGELPLLELVDIKEEIRKLPISVKGFSYGRPIRLCATYFDELVEENLLFGADGLFIQVHGSSKISNQFKKGRSYEIAVTLQNYMYKPSLEFIGLISEKDGLNASIPSKPQTRGAVEQYTIQVNYQSEKPNHIEPYESDFYSVYSFSGYVSTYQKGDKYYFVLTDELRENDFTSLESARNAKALFVNNKSEKAVNKASDLRYSSLYPYYENGKKVKVTYSPYMYNTQSYWMVFCHFSTLMEA